MWLQTWKVNSVLGCFKSCCRGQLIFGALPAMCIQLLCSQGHLQQKLSCLQLHLRNQEGCRVPGSLPVNWQDFTPGRSPPLHMSCLKPASCLTRCPPFTAHGIISALLWGWQSWKHEVLHMCWWTVPRLFSALTFMGNNHPPGISPASGAHKWVLRPFYFPRVFSEK